jgi:Dehydroquinase class II
VGIPFLEARRSNIHTPETLRRHVYFADLAVGTICGLGSGGCDLAFEYALGNKSETDAAGIAFPDIGEHEGAAERLCPPRVVAT